MKLTKPKVATGARPFLRTGGSGERVLMASSESVSLDIDARAACLDMFAASPKDGQTNERGGSVRNKRMTRNLRSTICQARQPHMIILRVSTPSPRREMGKQWRRPAGETPWFYLDTLLARRRPCARLFSSVPVLPPRRTDAPQLLFRVAVQMELVVLTAVGLTGARGQCVRR